MEEKTYFLTKWRKQNFVLPYLLKALDDCPSKSSLNGLIDRTYRHQTELLTEKHRHQTTKLLTGNIVIKRSY